MGVERFFNVAITSSSAEERLVTVYSVFLIQPKRFEAT